jgi:hypothetical protein
MNISVDKAGDLKIGRKKCRLYKKDEVVKVAKKYGIKTEKKTVSELCANMKTRVKNMNNVPLAKLYPKAAKKRAASKKVTPSRKAAIDKKIVTSFMKNMVTTNANIKKLRELNVKPSKKAQPITKEEAIRRIGAMKGLNRSAKGKLVNRIERGTMSPRRVVKVAREISRLNAPGYRVEL